MWFNSIHISEFEQAIAYQPEWLENELRHYPFKPCTAVTPTSYGFVPPIGDDTDAPLVYATQGYLVFCLQIQQKLLPASVLRDQHKEKVKQLENKLGKKVSRNEKQQMKEELEHTLLGQAFSRSNKVYLYVDTHKQRLIINSCNKNTLELCYKLCSQIFVEQSMQALSLQSISGILTSWLRYKEYPNSFCILDHCALEDNTEQKGKARFSKSDLYSDAVQGLLSDGSRVTGLQLNWCDKLHFTLKEDFSITSVKYLEEVKDLAKDGITETEADRFATDFFIMAETLSAFLEDLLPVFRDQEDDENAAQTSSQAKEVTETV